MGAPTPGQLFQIENSLAINLLGQHAKDQTAKSNDINKPKRLIISNGEAKSVLGRAIVFSIA